MFPGTVKKVMSCDAPGLSSLQAAKPLWEERMTLFRNEGVRGLPGSLFKRWCPDPCREDVRAGLFKQTCTCAYDGYRACAEGIMNYDYEEYLGKMERGDFMILAGENDTAIGPREVLVSVAAKIPGAKYVLMPDVGHVPPFHDPEVFNKIMLDFMQS